MPHLIIIDGYIGAGKTTLIESLCSKLNVAVVPEYIEEADGVQRFNQYLKDKKTNAYSFQFYILEYYHKYLTSDAFKEKMKHVDYVLMERNPIRGIEYYAKIDLLSGYITVEQYNYLYRAALNLLDAIKHTFNMHSLVTTYNTTSMTTSEVADQVLKNITWLDEVQLIADPECIKDRIKIRGREGEVETYDDTYINYMCRHYFE